MRKTAKKCLFDIDFVRASLCFDTAYNESAGQGHISPRPNSSGT
jgi:hypothetical protein